MSDDSALLGVLPGTTGAFDPESAYPGAGDFGLAHGTGTQQHGMRPILDDNGGSSMGDAVQDVWEWLNTPFKQPLSPTGIFALVGSVVLAIMVWNMILYHIRIAGEAI